MLDQAAQHIDTHPGPIGVFFRRIAKRKNRNVAVVATGRKLVAIAWHMLKSNEPYRYADHKSTEAKMSRFRIRATGKKRNGGNPKGQPRPAYHGTGNPTQFCAFSFRYCTSIIVRDPASVFAAYVHSSVPPSPPTAMRHGKEATYNERDRAY